VVAHDDLRGFVFVLQILRRDAYTCERKDTAAAAKRRVAVQYGPTVQLSGTTAPAATIAVG
jgi:hypothetical protein